MTNRAIRIFQRLQRQAARRPELPNTWWTRCEREDAGAVAELVRAGYAESAGSGSTTLQARLTNKGLENASSIY
jgi:hypothetical protein